MYPTISHLIKDVTGIWISLPVQTFGFFMALSILTGYYFLNSEVKRKGKTHLIQSFVTKKGRVVRPHEQINTSVLIALVSGIIGARLFSILEYPNAFLEAPLYTLLSPSDFTYYGGLIIGAIAVAFYARTVNLKFVHLADAAAPALMIAYAIGRLGCHLSGDGDWGIDNLGASPAIFGFLPDSFWACNYPHNVIGAGVPIANCFDDYCMQLSKPVFPTALHESIVCSLLFLVLWFLRKRIIVPGVMLGCYLILNGIERFLVEQIRIEVEFTWFGIRFKQAEAIALSFLTVGICMLLFILKVRQNKKAVITSTYLKFNNEYNR
ncbi:diacylglyceryl transferase [Sphingobacteriaceae bacterium]|nr:diacylglyceryl transferase [Sphingobacteriaceae bacterium]